VGLLRGHAERRGRGSWLGGPRWGHNRQEHQLALAKATFTWKNEHEEGLGNQLENEVGNRG